MSSQYDGVSVWTSVCVSISLPLCAPTLFLSLLFSAPPSSLVSSFLSSYYPGWFLFPSFPHFFTLPINRSARHLLEWDYFAPPPLPPSHYPPCYMPGDSLHFCLFASLHKFPISVTPNSLLPFQISCRLFYYYHLIFLKFCSSISLFFVL